MTGENVWLGGDHVQEETSRIVVPEPVVQIEIADTKATLFWAYDSEEDAIVISRLQDAFTDDQFEHVGHAQVMDNRVTNVPRTVMEKYEGFDFGEQLHFVTTQEYAANDMCMVLPEDVARDLFGDEFSGLFGGGDE